MKPSSPPEQKSIRISFFWLLVGLVLIFIVGIFGGLVGRALTQPQGPLIRSSEGEIVPVVQEVTISPSQAAGEMVAKSSRSVFALVPAGAEEAEAIGTLLLLTNDGLAVTAGVVRDQAPAAVDDTGRRVVLTRVGEDVLFGLTYFRLNGGVFVPLELRGENPLIGSRLLGLTRRAVSGEPTAFPFGLQEYQLPESTDPAGWQKMLRGEAVFAAAGGAPLLDDDGRVGGLLVDGESGRALPASALRESFERVSQNIRETDPYQDLGFTARFEFAPVEEAAPRFSARVLTVKAGSPAAIAGLKVGDSLLAIGDTNLTWGESVARQLTAERPLIVKVQRGTSEQTLTFSAN